MCIRDSIAFFDLGDNALSQPYPDTPRWVNHFAMEIRGEAELERMRQRLRDHGIEVVGPTDHHFIRSIYFLALIHTDVYKRQVLVHREGPRMIDPAPARHLSFSGVPSRGAPTENRKRKCQDRPSNSPRRRFSR